MTTRMRRRRRKRITTNTLGMILWLTTVQRRRKTKPLCPVVVRMKIQKIWTRTMTAKNRREGNVKDYEVLDDNDMDLIV